VQAVLKSTFFTASQAVDSAKSVTPVHAAWSAASIAVQVAGLIGSGSMHGPGTHVNAGAVIVDKTPELVHAISWPPYFFDAVEDIDGSYLSCLDAICSVIR
jgi:hypothetical protein